jgi:hypothetical protein
VSGSVLQISSFAAGGTEIEVLFATEAGPEDSNITRLSVDPNPRDEIERLGILCTVQQACREIGGARFSTPIQ